MVSFGYTFRYDQDTIDNFDWLILCVGIEFAKLKSGVWFKTSTFISTQKHDIYVFVIGYNNRWKSAKSTWGRLKEHPLIHQGCLPTRSSLSTWSRTNWCHKNPSANFSRFSCPQSHICVTVSKAFYFRIRFDKLMNDYDILKIKALSPSIHIFCWIANPILIFSWTLMYQ